jgi:hypothetical protein
MGQRAYSVDRRFISLRVPNTGIDSGDHFPVAPVVSELGLPSGLADAVDDASFDEELQRETDGALALTGKDVGTPIIHFQSPEGTAFFGPVISRLPAGEDATRLWDLVVGLASPPRSTSWGLSRQRRSRAGGQRGSRRSP